MNYYEELGVSPSASVGEIRQAYKALARLLHPDQCADEKLRGLAEIQMKRLNQILEVLADPGQRRRYDAALALSVERARRLYDEPPEPSRLRWARAARAAWPWAATAAVGVSAIISYFTYTGPKYTPPPTHTAATQANTEPAPPPARPIGSRPQGKSGEPGTARAAAEWNEWDRELKELRARQRALAQRARAAQHSALPPAPPVESPRAAPLKPVAAPEVQAEAPRDPAGLLAGSWFYVPVMAQPKTSGLYPPEYIELRLAEQDGIVRGRYRARYKVTDQAISPSVSFQFEGPGAAPSARLPWRGPGGAEGHILLKLLSESALEVAWTAHRLSGDLHLASGTAVLVRQQER